MGAGQTATVSVNKYGLRASRVLVYDHSENELNATKAVHLVNSSEEVLAPGRVSVLEGGFYCNQSQFVPMIPGRRQFGRRF